jgi:hypothetical protein
MGRLQVTVDGLNVSGGTGRCQADVEAVNAAQRTWTHGRWQPSPSRRASLALVLLLFAIIDVACRSGVQRSSLPTRLTDEEFRELSIRVSEGPGVFDHSENLVSNELNFVNVARALAPRGGVYIGVGPEQNFSYIAALRPELAFIIDIRQENRNLHLLYKALFELSTDRADFLSRLFSRERPPELASNTSVEDLFVAYERAKPAVQQYERTLRLVREQLVDRHRLPLSPDDMSWIGEALKAFYLRGPEIDYGRSHPYDPPRPSYRALMTATDGTGRSRSYLASEESFAFVKDLQSRNLIVPVVGDFAGPKAIRTTGEYIRQHHGIVTAFYGSNVEVYLTRDRKRAFCGSLATLPVDSRSWFIRSQGMQRFASKLGSCAGEAR